MQRFQTRHIALRNRCHDDGVHCPAASTLSADVLSTSNILSTHIMDPRVVDPLLKHTSNAVVHRIQIWRIRWPHLWRDKLWHLSLCSMRGDSVTCTMCWCPILLKRSNPRKQNGYPAEAYLAELYSGNSHH